MDDEILINIRSILAPRTQGLSLVQIKKEYFDLLGEKLLIGYDQMVALLSKCPGITNSYSTFLKQTVYHYSSAKTVHITNMNKSSEAVKKKMYRPVNTNQYNYQQRSRYVPPFRRQQPVQFMHPIQENGPQNPRQIQRELPPRFIKKCQTEEQPRTEQCSVNNVKVDEPPPSIQLREEQPPQQISEFVKEGYEETVVDDPNLDSIEGHYHKYTSHFCGRELIGDDFFLSCIEHELGHKQLIATTRPHIGFCLTGLTIADAVVIAEERHNFLYQVIVNLGSTDLILGNTVERMGQSFRQLIDVLDSKGANPIVTTLAPIGNNDPSIESKLKQFNRFLKSMFTQVVDLEMPMRQVSSGRPDPNLYDCSGPDKGPLKWSRRGRHRVLMTLFTYTADCAAITIGSTEKEVVVKWSARIEQ